MNVFAGFALLAAVVALLLGGAAKAAIINSSSNIALIAPPVSVALDALESDTRVRVFRESVSVLATPLPVDGGGGPGFSTSPFSIPAGTFVTSYLIHADPVGNPQYDVIYSGFLTFSTPILGLLFDQRLSGGNSDQIVGSLSTIYQLYNFRELELYYPCLVNSNDCFMVSVDSMTLSFDLAASSFYDQIRVIVAGEIPVPASFVLFVLGLAGMGASRATKTVDARAPAFRLEGNR